ncbi:FAD-dependent oxidoreductase [Secundilactobacillus collinoides]|uniref:Urocanate reductase n=1 Tax=Secundilactobacillus collinoides DSM 20515 = JCM 1123 TaxID=1423733 RepID=A0A0R2B5U9_SECCO|nr:FAD-dependent oxidoreductase [Secundilactobacillus collinoides]KRM74560.1 hypothetical protein FC82_GL003219 [Secundilactobacillus collinoides DSM 20515 = JCM 1123]
MTEHLKNGTFVGTGKGFKNRIVVSATIENDEIQSVKLVSSADSPEVGEKIIPTLVKEANDTKAFKVDAVSGASFTSGGFNQAMADVKRQALGQSAPTDTKLTDGTYSATVKSLKDREGLPGVGEMTLSATFADDQITQIETPAYTDTRIMGGMAFDILKKQVIGNQSTDVDAVTGATVSSNAFISALDDCIQQAGGDPTAFSARHIDRPVPKTQEINTDLVVIGAGMAGLSSAIEGKTQGADVILCEAQQVDGSSTTRSEGFVMGANTPEQKKNGISDSTDDFYNDIHTLYKNEPTLDEGLLHKLTADSTDLNRFLVNNGVKWSGVTHVSEKGVRNRKRAHTSAGYGAELVETLVKSAEDKGVDLRFGTKVSKLIIEDGAVKGVEAETTNGDHLTIHAGAVVVASGSYTENADLVAELNPRMDNIEVITGRGNGASYRFFKQAGADIVDVPYIQMMYYFYGASWGNRFPEAIPGSPTVPNYDVLEIDGGGKRVASEDDFCFEYTKKVWDGGYDEGYAVYGQTVADKYPEMTDLGLTTQTAHGKPFGYKEDSIADLAKDVDIDPEALQATVDRYNALCAKGSDDDFHKEASHMVPINGPYYILRLPQICTDGYTGAKINTNAQVIGKNGQPIPGLYACGSCADGQMTGIDYFGCGTSLLTCGVFGRAAAKDAVSKLSLV